MDNFGYIYRITNLKNGMVYIGKKSGTLDEDYWGGGLLIQTAVASEGIQNFKREILVFAKNTEMLYRLERREIYEHKKKFGMHRLYNIAHNIFDFTPEGRIIHSERYIKSKFKLRMKYKYRITNHSWVFDPKEKKSKRILTSDLEQYLTKGFIQI